MPRERFTLALRSPRLRSSEVSTARPSYSKSRPRIATYYARLKVAQDAPPEVIRAAHRALVQKYHPDRHKGSLRHEQVVAALNRAQDVLLDPETRAAHDQWIRDEEVRMGLREPPDGERTRRFSFNDWLMRRRQQWLAAREELGDTELGWMGVGPRHRSPLRRYGAAIALMVLAAGAGAGAMIFAEHGGDIGAVAVRELPRSSPRAVPASAPASAAAAVSAPAPAAEAASELALASEPASDAASEPSR